LFFGILSFNVAVTSYLILCSKQIFTWASIMEATGFIHPPACFVMTNSFVNRRIEIPVCLVDVKLFL
jgi:hypothetical protein